MKNIFAISILTILITTQVHSQKKMSAYNVKKYGDKWYADNEDTPFTGIMFLLDESTGVKTHELHFKDGLRNGLRTEWNKNRIKIAEGSYKNGKREGKHLTTIESGRGQYIINYVNGKADYSKGQYKDLATGIIIEGKLSDYNDIDEGEYFYDESSYILFKGDINLGIAPIEVIQVTAKGTLLVTIFDKENDYTNWTSIRELNDKWDYLGGKYYNKKGQIKIHEYYEGKVNSSYETRTFIEWYDNGQMKVKAIRSAENKILEYTEWDQSGKIINQE